MRAPTSTCGGTRAGSARTTTHRTSAAAAAGRSVASFDSASAMLRAVGRFLHGKDFPHLGVETHARHVVPLANALPPYLRRMVYAYTGWIESVRPGDLRAVRAEALSRWVVSHYPRRRYPAIAIGSSNGAAVHLWSALGIPWLPQTLFVPVSQPGVHPDDMRESMEWGREPGAALLANNPDLQLHHMHDPNQDRLMIRRMAYFRVKRRTLGETYTRFIEQHLAPGGTIFLIECNLHWPTTQVGERHYFQPGADGGATPDEYLHGSARVHAHLKAERSHRTRWEPPEPDGERPEAEWGFEPSLREDVQRVAKERDLRVRRILFERPDDLSPLIADLYRWWYRARGLPDDRLLADSFILMDPWWTLRAGLVPYWAFFPVERAVADLSRYLDEREMLRSLHVMLFSHGEESIGYAPIERWRKLISRTHEGGGFVGVSQRAFPRDFATFVRYHRALKRLPWRCPMPEPLTLAQFDTFLDETHDRYPVQCRDAH